MHARVVCAVALSLVACGTTRTGVDGGDASARETGPSDAPTDALTDAHGDAGGSDGGMDATVRDAATDASTADAGRMDASVDGGVADAGPSDASPRDAGVTDAGDAGATTIECVPVVPPNELNSGIVFSAGVWSGFRFQITTATTAVEVGLNVQNEGAAGATAFGAIVALSGMSDEPDSPDLTTPDVLATTSISLGAPGASHTVSGTVSVPLAPGWYAAMFGTGAFGATATTGTIHSNSGGGGCTNGGGFPFSIRESDGMFILQGATPNFFVVTSP